MELSLGNPQLVGKIDVQQQSPSPIREAQRAMNVGVGETNTGGLGAEPFEGRVGAGTGALALCACERERERYGGGQAPWEARAGKGLTRWPETRA